MTHPDLVILGYSEAAMFLRATPPPNVCGIISIHGQREFGVINSVSHRLDLQFDDVDVPDPDDEIASLRAAGRKRWCELNGLTEAQPRQPDAQAIIDFATRLKNAEGIVLCHCGAGMSRAPAAALICLRVWRGPGSEAECIAEVRRLRNGAVPHVSLARYADRLLGGDSRLAKAIRDFRL